MGKIDTIQVGDRASLKKTATDACVKAMAEITGDFNKMHVDDAYAAKTVFGRRIAHGLFCLGMVSNLLGTQLPGEGTVLLSQEIKYKLPVYIGDEIEAVVEVTEIFPEKSRVHLAFWCVNQNGKTVLEGSTAIKWMEVED